MIYSCTGDYSTDFKESKGYTMTKKAKFRTQQSSVSDCAQLCVAETGFSCDSFIFCTDRTCRLQTESLFDVDHVSAIPYEWCSIYNREYKLFDHVKKINQYINVVRLDCLQAAIVWQDNCWVRR